MRGEKYAAWCAKNKRLRSLKTWLEALMAFGDRYEDEGLAPEAGAALAGIWSMSRGAISTSDGVPFPAAIALRITKTASTTVPINQRRFERLIIAKSWDEFYEHMLTCIKIVNVYSGPKVSAESIYDAVVRFSNRFEECGEMTRLDAHKIFAYPLYSQYLGTLDGAPKK